MLRWFAEAECVMTPAVFVSGMQFMKQQLKLVL